MEEALIKTDSAAQSGGRTVCHWVHDYGPRSDFGGFRDIDRRRLLSESVRNYF